MKKRQSKILPIYGALFCAACLFAFVPKTAAVSLDGIKFPRLANIFLKTPITPDEMEMLAKWDIVALGMQAQDTDPQVFSYLRQHNPDIVILAYVASAEFPVDRLDQLESANGPWHELMAGIKDEWWLKQDNGQIVSFWPGNQSLNVSDEAPLVGGMRWNTYFPKFLDEQIMSTGNWDGIFFDSVWETASWVNGGNMDLNNDGGRDTGAEIDARWNAGMRKIFSESRARMGNGAIFIGNGGDCYSDFLNGRMFESFPSQFENYWAGMMPKYFSFMNNGASPAISIINGDTLNTGAWNNFQDMRYALTSTLMDNGFFSYDWGTMDHSQVWWYDEFDAVLGNPTEAARNLSSGASPAVSEGLWRRDFQKGIVIVNSTNVPKTVILEDAFERLSGTQAPQINNGDLTTSFTLAAHDGVILMRRIFLLENAPFINGARTKVFNKQGAEVHQDFYSFTDQAEGGTLAEVKDVDNDGSKETIYSVGNIIYVRNQNGSLRSKFYPYSNIYRGRVNFDVGDVDGDGKAEIVTGTGQGGGPHVRIFSARGLLKNAGFFAYEKTVRHGVRVAIGDLNADGKAEIVTGPGFGAGPQVRIFEGKTGRLLSGGFFAYDKRIRIGVNIAVGDVDGDGKAEIVTGAGPGGGPHVRIFDSQGKPDALGFFAYNPKDRNGVRVAVTDIAGSSVKEIIAFQSNYSDI